MADIVREVLTAKGPARKVVVFSQWTAVLDACDRMLSAVLPTAGVGRLDGR